MTETADVVVIGGGVIGLSIAYHLAERGVRDVVVLEADRCGSGATLRATGGVRHQFGTEINVRLSLLSRSFWLGFDERFGATACFRQLGYLFLLTTPEVVAAGERGVAMQQALGAPARLVTPAEAAALSPGLNTEGVLAATFCPWDGVLEVEGVVAGLLMGCRRFGVTPREGVTVTGLTVASGRIQQVVTSAGSLTAPVVVNAAGADAADVGALAGMTLPIHGERRQAAVTAPTAGIDPHAAMTIDLGTGCYARPDLRGGAVIGGGDQPTADAVSIDTVDEPGLARLRATVGQRFPGLAGVSLTRVWAGRRPMTPDDHAILGPTAIEGFLIAGGMGSHGLMHAPAVGHLMAELIVDGATPSLDIAPLGPDRFARGALLAESVRF